jgi:hypothetical protein
MRAAKPLSLALLLCMLLGLAAAKTQLDFGLGPRAHDADFYYTVARNVAEGRGPRTNLSLYLQGFQSFPHRVTQSPVWPLTLGLAGRGMSLPLAATALPTALFFVDLVLLYFLALRLHRRIAPGNAGWIFREDRIPNFGHLAVAVLGTNAIFFRFSSVPNNDPLAFGLVFGALIALDRAAESRSVAWAGASGVLAGLACLTRFQMIPLAIALLAVLAGHALRDRSALRLLGAGALGCAVPFVPWIAYLASWADPLRPAYVLGLEVQRETPELTEFSHTRSLPSLSAYVRDRMSGFAAAFHPTSRGAYTNHFGALPYLVLLASIPLAGSVSRKLRALIGGLEARQLLPAATLLAGIGMLVPVHLGHMTFSREWLFGFRHGLPILLLILPAIVYLDAHRFRPFAVAAAVGLLATAFMNYGDMARLLRTSWPSGIHPLHQEVVYWLDFQPTRVAVVTTLPWEFGTFSRSGYHWILCEHPPTETLALLRHAKADYVLVTAWQRECPFIRGLPGSELRVAKQFGDGQITLYALRDRE